MLLVIYAYIRTYIHEYTYSLQYIEVYKAVETIIRRPTNIFCKLQILVKEINPLRYTEKKQNYSGPQWRRGN